MDDNQNPAGQQPAAGTGSGAPIPPPPPPPADLGGAPLPPPPPPGGGLTESPLLGDEDLSEDQFITGGADHSEIRTLAVPPHPAIQFDDKEFLDLLAGSISLTKTEKQRIIQSIPKLSQYQIDELLRIFREEKVKFDELNAKHAEQMAKLQKQHEKDWQDIEREQKEAAQKQKAEEEAAQLRAMLMGGAANDNSAGGESKAA